MYEFYKSCVDWPDKDIHEPGGLVDMLNNNMTISRRTFLMHVPKRQLVALEERLGYAKHWQQGLTMAGDWHVTYHRSKWHYEWVYYLRHSAIEYVFVDDL